MRVVPAALLSGMLAIATTAGKPALAQDDADLVRAERAFKGALADEQAGLYEKAAAELVEARTAAKKETPQLLFHLGVCHAHMGRLLAARDELRAAVERAQKGGLENVAATARAELDTLQKRVPSIRVARPAHGTLTSLTVDSADVTPKLGQPVDVDPGPHDVEASFADAAPSRLHVSVAEGEHRELTLPEATPAGAVPLATAAPPALSPVPPSPPASPPPEPPPAPPPSPGTRTLGWAVLGGGAGFVAGGAVLWVLRGQEVSTLGAECGTTRQQCPGSAQGDIDRGKLYDALGITLLVAGGAAVLAGGGLLLFGGGSTTATTGVRAFPVLAAHGGGIGVGGPVW